MDKKHSGQIWKPPKAADWNALASAANLVGRQSGNIDGVRGSRPDIQPLSVVVKNSSGGAREQYDVLVCDGTNLLESTERQNRWLGADLELVMPGAVAVLLRPAESNALADAAVAGVTWARVNLQTAFDDRAYPADGEHVLQGGFFGPAAILWKPTPTGYPSTEVCLVLLNAPCQPRWCFTGEGAIDAGTKSGTGSSSKVVRGEGDVWMGTEDSSGDRIVLLDGSTPVTCGVFNPLSEIAEDVWVLVQADEYWRPCVIVEECPT